MPRNKWPYQSPEGFGKNDPAPDYENQTLLELGKSAHSAAVYLNRRGTPGASRVAQLLMAIHMQLKGGEYIPCSPEYGGYKPHAFIEAYALDSRNLRYTLLHRAAEQVFEGKQQADKWCSKPLGADQKCPSVLAQESLEGLEQALQELEQVLQYKQDTDSVGDP